MLCSTAQHMRHELLCIATSAFCDARVEPKGDSHVFIVHGEACHKTNINPTCSQDRYGTAQGRMYVLDFKALMGSDWRVSCHVVLTHPLDCSLGLPAD